MNKNIDKPNIILIVMDAVRVDHLSCYGYTRKTSPNIDGLAKEGILFENAFSTAAWSYPSHASIFTGKYPSFHRTLGKDVRLHKENTTIAEVLSREGYQTIGVSSNNLLSPINGFDKGFQKYFVFDLHYEETKLIFKNIKQCPRDFIRTLVYGLDGYTYRNLEKIKYFLKKRIKRKPFFLFTNFYNCHTPYNPPRPFKKRFCKLFDRIPLSVMELIFYKIFGHPGGKIPGFDIRKLNMVSDENNQISFMEREFDMSEEEWEIVKSWYDGEILYLDCVIGELVDFLKREGVFENTVFIITSDHGENFGEHGLVGHQFCLYDTLIHVPLIIVYPDVIPRGVKISSLVSHIDIFPTILDLLGIKGYRRGIQGESLLPFRDRKIHDFVCAECGEFRISHLHPKLKVYERGYKCLRTESFKYIISADRQEELYNIKKDPHEEINIAEQYPEKTKYFRKQLEKTIDISFFGPQELPEKRREEIKKRLHLLGYI